MTLENFEQVTLTLEVIGDAVKYLKPNTVIEVELFAGNPVGVNLPKSMDLKVVNTEPRLQGATKTSLYKPAVLETGAVVQVPEFIKEGDVIRVDTRDDTYLERAKAK